MKIDFNFKQSYGIQDLIEIMGLLRSENGCPWDKEQTHASIKSNVIEEAYEVVDAIEQNSIPALREELGDLLLQVVFHSEIESENGSFNFSDVCDEICKKLIIRHPHIFGEVSADTSEQVLNNWEKIKNQTKGVATATETLKNVPKFLPALMRANKIQSRAIKAGVKPDGTAEIFNALQNQLLKLNNSEDAQDKQAIAQEFKQLLFKTVALGRALGLNSEELLAEFCDEFIADFEQQEKLTQVQGKNLFAFSVLN
ncbi:MAG TPA: nucleoside triphosphate pyrophosphohydrolase [Ruminococcaceae bacterium]|nr:nucleoside triphosphate pyrophosphohydrolase [Oscillospiraceae bacterium]